MKKYSASESTHTPLLDSLYDKTQSIHDLSLESLESLAQEVRNETLYAVSQTGGHLGAGLGVVELSVALHHVFNTPEDKLIWDVGHQTYPHKILTDRYPQIHTLRQPDGLAGFTKRSESPYDPFGAGHSSTSISAALGMATARDLAGKKNEVIAVIGDGALSAGMAYEAMNNAGAMHSRMIVILNDNEMSIASPVGAMSAYLSRLISSRPYLTIRHAAKNVASHLPDSFEKVAKRAEQYARTFATGGGNFFEEMGFYYVGPIDGHNLSQLLPILKNIRDDHTIERPVLIHAVTEKGRGFESPEASQEKYHAVSKFDINTGVQIKPKDAKPTYTHVFSSALMNAAKDDEKIVAITAAMPSGTGLSAFAKAYPDRTFDVGIAEQHAVTFAAGLAAEGYKPFVAIYSTFLQRAYDQIVHDVAIQNLPVRFAIDRAGFVGEDGPTHAGSFDIVYLASLPHMVVMAASDEQELAHMVATAAAIDDAPSAVRYPRGKIVGDVIPQKAEVLPIGKGRIVYEPEAQHQKKVAILSFGTRLEAACEAAKLLTEKHNVAVTVADARFAKPLDMELIKNLVTSHDLLITIEEGSVGGFGSHVAHHVAHADFASSAAPIHPLCFPDRFVDHNKADVMYAECGLDGDGVKNAILALV